LGSPPPTSASTALPSVAGTWKLKASNVTGGITATNCQQGCYPVISGPPFPDTGSVTVTIQQNGKRIKVTVPGTATTVININGPLTLTGAITGQGIRLDWSTASSAPPPGSQVVGVETFQVTGSLLAANRLSGKYVFSDDLGTGYLDSYAGDWIATKTASASPTATTSR
jgi:hypothetical protein